MLGTVWWFFAFLSFSSGASLIMDHIITSMSNGQLSSGRPALRTHDFTHEAFKRLYMSKRYQSNSAWSAVVPR